MEKYLNTEEYLRPLAYAAPQCNEIKRFRFERPEAFGSSAC